MASKRGPRGRPVPAGWRDRDAELLTLLTQPPPAGAGGAWPEPLATPALAVPVHLRITEVRACEQDPPRRESPAYPAIRASLQAVGLEQRLLVTRRPGARPAVLAAGGATRLRALQSLWARTRDPRFEHVDCLLRPRVDESECGLGHLRENALRAPLTRLERALAVRRLRAWPGPPGGAPLTRRELAGRSGERGYPVSESLLRCYEYVSERLYPVIPLALEAGLAGEAAPIRTAAPSWRDGEGA